MPKMTVAATRQRVIRFRPPLALPMAPTLEAALRTTVNRVLSDRVQMLIEKKDSRGFPASRGVSFQGTVCCGRRQECFYFKAATSAGSSNCFGSNFVFALNEVNWNSIASPGPSDITLVKGYLIPSTSR